MSLPLPAEFEHRGRSHYLLHCHGVGLPGWHDLGVATPGWNGGRMTFSLLETRLIVSRVSRSCRNGETLPPLGGVAGGPRQTLTRTDWVYDVNVPVPFEGWMLIGEQDDGYDWLNSIPKHDPEHPGTYFELGFVAGELREEIDLSADMARILGEECERKTRVQAPELVALLARIDTRYEEPARQRFHALLAAARGK